MSIKKYTNNAWVSIPYKEYGTEADTITTLPKTIIADGASATATIKGNLSQSGTPTPSSPIYPSETGDKTANLFNPSILANNKSLNSNGVVVDSAGRIATITPIDVSDYTSVTLSYTSNSVSFMYAIFNGATLVERTAAKASGASIDVTGCDALYISFYKASSITTDDVTEIMLNEGSTALPFDKFGYKIPILCGGTTTPVYLGEVQSERKIKKVVFTGSADETWNGDSLDNKMRYYPTPMITNGVPLTEAISTHFAFGGFNANSGANGTITGTNSSSAYRMYFWSSDYATVDAWKSFLAQQYAAGTPVTVWYVLATPTTTTLNEPLRKIGTYADSISNVASIPTTSGSQTFDVQTDLKPSEVDLTYHGWHEHSDKKYSGGSWT